MTTRSEPLLPSVELPSADPPVPMLRVLLLVSKLESDWTGGIGRVVAGHARTLAQQGHAVQIAGPAAAPPGPIAGVKLRPWPPRRRPLARVPAFLEELLIWNPDVVHVHSALPRWPLVAAAALVRSGRGRPRIVVTPHTGSRAHYRSRWAREALRLADAVVTVSYWSAERAIDAGAARERIAVVPPGFAVPKPRLRPATNRTISVFARLAASKGIDIAILAFDRAARSRPGWHLVIAGRGREAASLRTLAASLPTTDRIHLVGWLAGEAKTRLLADSAIGLVPSRADNLPATLLEFQAEGIACICSETGGLPEAAESGNAGLLVPPGDVLGLANGLALLMDDADLRLRLATRGLECARARSWEAVTDRLLNVYRRIAAENSPFRPDTAP